ncbi:nucleotidyltransferase family protein [Chloroflexi bacterium TSY]|nr:nucleotidyltransferase family protein [Chloroflexi bacterium TSY]
MNANYQPRPTTNEIRQTLRAKLPELMERYGVVSLGLFGSFVRSEQTPISDVDLLVEIDNPHMTLLQFVELRHYLSDLLGIDVDLVERETLKPALGKRILREVELL